MLSEKDTVSAAAEPPVSPAVTLAGLGSGWPAADSRVTARFQVQFQRRRQRLVSAPLSAANSSQIKTKTKQTHGFTDIYNNKLASG